VRNYFQRIPKGVYIVTMLYVFCSIMYFYAFFYDWSIYLFDFVIKGYLARYILIFQTIVFLFAGIGLLFLNRITWLFALFAGGANFLLGCLTLIFLSSRLVYKENLLKGYVLVSDGDIISAKIILLLIMIAFYLLPLIYLYKVRSKFHA